MMNELEIEAADFRRNRINEKVEEIKREQSGALARNFIDAFCLIESAIEEWGPADDLKNKLTALRELRKESFDQHENAAMYKIEASLANTQTILKRFYKNSHKWKMNIFDEALQGSVILPKLHEAMKAIEGGFTEFDIFPGGFDYDQVVKGCPHWLRVNQEIIEDDEVILAEERPKKFYTMASPLAHDASEKESGWGHLEHDECQQKYFEKYAAWERNGLYLVGLTPQEYIYLQIARQRNVTPVPPFYGGWDERCGCLLLGEEVENTRTHEASYLVGFWDNSGRADSKLTSGAEILIVRADRFKRKSDIEPRFAINFVGDSNE